jgi:ketosteroid isomerase-like protein
MLLSLIVSCNTSTSSPGETLSEIIKADNSGDVDKIVSLYTNDAMLMPAGKPNISGSGAIRKNYEGIFSASKVELTATTDEVYQSEEFAVIRGNTTGKIHSLKDSSTVDVNDKFIMMLKKVSGQWKIHWLMWSKYN